MMDSYEREQIHCVGCGHIWILISDKEITDYIHKLWLIKVWEQHKYINIFPEGDFNEEKS